VAAAGRSLAGGRPSGTPADLTAVHGGEWRAFLRRRVESGLEEHADTRFSDLTRPIRSWVDERTAALSGPFEPALCRNDHGLYNLLVAADGSVGGRPDWAYTLATPPAYDLASARIVYGAPYLAGLEGASDRLALVRKGLEAGYRTGAEPPVCEAAAWLRLMTHFDRLQLPPGSVGRAVQGLRGAVRARLS
jgi:hypothetical protein